MILLVVMTLIFFPQLHFAQNDQIILPELDLIIEDQSTLSTVSSEDAVLKERTPEFQEVYFEELMTGLSDASINKALSQKNVNKITQLGFSYGSFDNVIATAFAQNIINNVFYQLSYQGQFRQNVALNNKTFENTGLYRNILNAHIDGTINNAILGLDVGYQQRNQRFITNTNHNQDMHYVPITFTSQYWLTDVSFLDIAAHTGFALLRQQNTEFITTKENLIVDLDVNLAYRANFNEKNYFEIEGIYRFNDYSIAQANTGILKIKNDFKFTQLFTMRLGVGLVSSTENHIFGWPEIAFIVNHLNTIIWDMKITGDFNLYNAQRASQEVQFFSLNPSPESRWIYSTALKYIPHSVFNMELNVAYSDYNAKRLYHYDDSTQLYSFMTVDTADILETGVKLNVQTENIFGLYIAYHYQHIPRDWLLYSPHKFDVILDLGYKPVGFNIKTHYTLYSDRLLRPGQESPIINLLNIKISQKILKVAELFIEVNNILNQDIQFISGTVYGGVQANGGITLNF